jgi:hypothetical protein
VAAGAAEIATAAAPAANAGVMYFSPIRIVLLPRWPCFVDRFQNCAPAKPMSSRLTPIHAHQLESVLTGQQPATGRTGHQLTTSGSGPHTTWRCHCSEVTYRPALAEHCRLLNGRASTRRAQ